MSDEKEKIIDLKDEVEETTEGKPLQPSTKPGQMTPDEAVRCDRAAAAVNAILKEYGVNIIPLITIGPTGIFGSSVKIIPNREPSRIIQPGQPKIDPSKLKAD